MTPDRICDFFRRIGEMNPRPVITVTKEVFNQKNKRYDLYRCSGVFGWWNVDEGSFEARETEKKKLKKGHCYIFRPFYLHEIVSVEITTERQLIDDRNLLFRLEESVKEARSK